MDYKIVHLPKEEWQGHILPIGYTTPSYYDVKFSRDEQGFDISLKLTQFPEPVTHSPDEYDYVDRLYAPYHPNSFAWGVIENGELVAAIETMPEEWSNRLRVNELWVSPEYQKKGLGKALMNVAKEQARQERRRAITLETQSCNVNAIGFYTHEGFELIGMDRCCYSNRDIEKCEMRLEFGYLIEKKERIPLEKITIRAEKQEDYTASEKLAMLAFWNKHHRGCSEHLLVRRLRRSADYLPELSRIALVDGKVVGLIMYSKAKVVGENGEGHEVLSFGPLCVLPEAQGCGIGEALFAQSARLAKEAGYKGIVIFGEPDYYPRLGFKTCDNFGITTSEGKNFDAFMAYELFEGSLSGVNGKFYESPVFEELPEDEVEAMNAELSAPEKQKFPTQWD